MCVHVTCVNGIIRISVFLSLCKFTKNNYDDLNEAESNM